MDSKGKIIAACDNMSLDDAGRLADKLAGRGSIWGLKGNSLLVRPGLDRVVAHFKERGLNTMADLKLYDIPETVHLSVLEAREAGAAIVTVHASAGPAAMKAAVGEQHGELIVAAITVLTSFDDSTCADVYHTDVATTAERLGLIAKQSGAVAVVCSAHEVARFANEFSPVFMPIRIVPGIRMPEGDQHDQKRVATPGVALRNGASLIVLGRALTQGDVLENLKRIEEDIEAA